MKSYGARSLGDPILPSAFLERRMIFRKLQKNGIIVHGKNKSYLKFADDIDLLEKTYKKLQKQFQS